MKVTFPNIAGIVEELARPKPLPWDEWFMQIAKVVSQRSSCVRLQVGAVIARNKQIISTGYTGTPKGAKNCNKGGCPRCNTPTSEIPRGTALDTCLCAHAEANAITQAAFQGTRVEGATLYTTHFPCLQCAKTIINAGITEVVYGREYPGTDVSRTLLSECNVSTRKVKC